MRVKQVETYVRYADAGSMAGQPYMVIKDGAHLTLVLDRAVRKLPDDQHELLLEDAWDAVKEAVREGIAPTVPHQRRTVREIIGDALHSRTTAVAPVIVGYGVYAKGVAALVS